VTTEKYLFKDKHTTELELSAWDIGRAIWRAPGPAWLTGTEKKFLAALNSHDGGERIYPSYATLRREAVIASDDTIKKLIDALVAKGWLLYAAGDRVRSNEYLITVPESVQRVQKISKAGNPYIDFIFTDEPPGYVPRTTARGAGARKARKDKRGTTATVEPKEPHAVESGTTPTVEATTVTVEPGTTPTVVEVKTLREKEGLHCSQRSCEPIAEDPEKNNNNKSLTRNNDLGSSDKDFDRPALTENLLAPDDIELVSTAKDLDPPVRSFRAPREKKSKEAEWEKLVNMTEEEFHSREEY
jgi:hypothetical protein